MTTQEVANKFHELAQTGKWDEILNTLFAENAKSIEPAHTKGMQTVEGLDAIKKKGEVFNNMIVEMHSGYCTPPVVAGSRFSVGMGIDVTTKEQGRMNMEEIAVYEVKDGKIISEQFIY